MAAITPVLDPLVISNKILEAKHLAQVLDVSKFSEEFRSIIKVIHSDVCSLPEAAQATAKLNQFKEEFENGKKFTDETGEFRTNGYWVEFESKEFEKNLNWSFENHAEFMKLADSASQHFKKYLPHASEMIAPGKYRFYFENRAIPLSGLVLEQKHVQWVLNRLLEYSAYLNQMGWAHCGLTPESVFIVPETHGIQICSFYHLSRLNRPVGTISAKYSNWYPTKLFSDKIATAEIDIELSKRIAIYLLGDESGTGIKLRKTHDEKFLDFCVTHHTEAWRTMDAYKKFLKANYKSEFHILNI